MQMWSLKALQGRDAVPRSFSGPQSETQSMRKLASRAARTSQDTAPAKPSKGKKQLSAPYAACPQPAALTDSHHFARKKKEFYLLEVLRFKNNIYSGFLFWNV